MGGLCSEGHEFLRLCRKRNPVKAELLLDVLVTQHSKWTARRVHRALFGQNLIDFSGDSWTCLTTHSTTSKISNRCQRRQPNQQHILSNFTRKFDSTARLETTVITSNNDECACSNFDSSEESSDFEGDSAGAACETFSKPNPERPASAILDHVAMDVGTEDLQDADQESAPASRRCEFFDLSPR